MFSENKIINYLIYVLLYLCAINIAHFGQLAIPIICIILFIDNKFKFHMNNLLTFIVLLLFGISFFAFTYNFAGIYSTIGLFLPMAYYIGSNLKVKSEENIKYLIYILAFGMVSHALLNFACDVSVYGRYFANNQIGYDIWYGAKVSRTGIAINFTLFLSIFYYLFFYEKNNRLKYLGIFVLFAISIYDIGLGRRTPIFMFLVSIIICLILDIFVYKKIKINKKIILTALILVLVVVAILGLFGSKIFAYTTILAKFEDYGLNPERLDIFFGAIKIMPQYLWGGQQMQVVLENPVHDLWMDIYDYAGVIPFILIIVYSILCIKVFIKLIKNKEFTKPFKLLIISFVVCCFIQCCLEPIISGASIFLLCFIIAYSAIESLISSN